MCASPPRLPVIDVAPLARGEREEAGVADAIGRACREFGFFYVVGHGIDPDHLLRLEDLARRFFALDVEEKMAIRMALGGRAWRGYFPVGAELTSGRPDQKEGLYFGAELDQTHPAVAAGRPLHGRNLFPARPEGLREAVLAHLDAMTGLGHRVLEGIALSLGLARSYFADRYTRDPFVLFRIFHYPPLPADARAESLWSVGEHTDYGLLTLLLQDSIGGLAVKSPAARARGEAESGPAAAGWIEAPPVPGAFVCNIGDMLDRMTGGLYRSTPHRVRNRSDRGRLSFPFFFDPAFDAEIEPIPTGVTADDDRAQRWDGTSVHEWRGTYGEYLLRKVGKVFPERRNVLE